ncbi:lipid IV(A) 3-deoxy-D-manno-octulosonic acid transferase [Allorhizobium sp. BGMRC 0089]|uniref:lipid IV(A) 3-deoxy-D-manno-octulosonic acid transferase n=1 Tax=Allorhizobium sonneratiae TaxID=2934936 RepID=UPI00203347E9|nr:lipid IV(A) 3-deoxy-D-manno-octulosonic acid transferase [Allorhizobium sonneratiae]MCM2291316.1 lipid IV(A) 3-deoxy-D-manno-octulosonic acid transferase [Allorhizobium sonneratiae]
MSALAQIALIAYRCAGIAGYPCAGLFLNLRARRGKEDRARKMERVGYASANRPRGPLVWVHAASVGEMMAVSTLMRELRRADINVLLTTGTVTSAEMASNRLQVDVIHQYVPLDALPAVRRFLDYWHPDLAIGVESEIWPATLSELNRRKIPQVLVNARLSDRSFKRWQKHPLVAHSLFSQLAMVIAQSDLDAERFRDLGAWPVITSGNIKVETDAPPCDPALLSVYDAQIGHRKTWAATSTAEGEEKVAAMVHRALKAHMGQLTIIVPRHIERADEIEAMMTAQGLTVARRSRNDPITPDTDIFLGDSMGEMGLYLRLTEIAFVGRSLVAKGGGNPLEPAVLGCAVLSGPHVENFRDTYQALVKKGAARLVRDAEMLAKGVHFLMNNPVTRHKMADAGMETVQDMRGALSATMKALEPFTHPLTMQARLEPRTAAGE